MKSSLQDFETIRQIEWSKSWLWDVRFPDAPDKFSSWFPASDVTEQLAAMNTLQFDGPLTSYKIPQSSMPLSVGVTFYDDIDGTLLEWLSDWINEIVRPSRGYVLPLSQSCKTLLVSRLNSARDVIMSSSYLVIPDSGILSFQGNSNSASLPLSYQFHIVKVVNRQRQS